MRKSIIMLMMLVIVLMTCSIATADELPLQKVPAGYFVSEDVAQGIIERYPELEQIFKNVMKVESGSYMSDPVTIELGNKIEEIKASEDKWKEKFDVTYEALQEERQKVKEMKAADENVIELLNMQVEGWEERYRKTQLYNTVEKGALAVIIALLAVN